MKEAEEIIADACRHFGIAEEELFKSRRGDLTRAAVAWKIWGRTSLRQKWIADRLSMSTAANVSQVVKKFENLPEERLDKKLKQWMKI